MEHKDELYGAYDVPYPKLLREAAVIRAGGIGVAGVPITWINGEHGTSRLEHGMGVYRLMHACLAWNGRRDVDMEIAALIHDIGHTAFSHCGERFLPGFDHERNAADIARAELADAIRASRGNPERVSSILEGTDAESMLLAGSLDMDNIDNTQRYALDVRLWQSRVYNGMHIAQAFEASGKRWTLHPDIAPQLKKWQYVRQKTYDFVYGVHHLGKAALLEKALCLFKDSGGDIGELLRCTDAEAAEVLRYVPFSREYIRRLDRKERVHYLGEIKTTKGAEEVCRAVAKHLHTDPCAIVAAGPSKNRNKKVHIPFSDGTIFDVTTNIPHGFKRVYSLAPLKKATLEGVVP